MPYKRQLRPMTSSELIQRHACNLYGPQDGGGAEPSGLQKLPRNTGSAMNRRNRTGKRKGKQKDLSALTSPTTTPWEECMSPDRGPKATKKRQSSVRTSKKKKKKKKYTVYITGGWNRKKKKTSWGFASGGKTACRGDRGKKSLRFENKFLRGKKGDYAKGIYITRKGKTRLLRWSEDGGGGDGGGEHPNYMRQLGRRQDTRRL